MTWSESLGSLPRCCDVSNVQIFTRSDLAPPRRCQFAAPQLWGSAGSCSLLEEEFIQKEQKRKLERRWRVGGEVEEKKLSGKVSQEEMGKKSNRIALNVQR